MSLLKYEPDILERVECLSRSQDYRRRTFEEITQILYDRQRLEEFYARSLEKLCESLSRLSLTASPGGSGESFFKPAVQIIAAVFSCEAEQSGQFASSISTEILPLLRDACKEDSLLLKNISKIGERHQRDLVRHVGNFDSKRKAYVAAAQACDAKARKPVASSSSEQEQAAASQRYTAQQKVNSEVELKKEINQYNAYINEYFLDVTRVEQTIIDEELSKRNTFKDAIMKTLVFEVSRVRNLQYDVDRIADKFNAIDVEANIKQFVNDSVTAIAAKGSNGSQETAATAAAKKPKPLLSKLSFDNYKCFVEQSITEKNTNQSVVPHPQQRQPPSSMIQQEAPAQQQLANTDQRQSQVASQPKQRQRIFQGIVSFKPAVPQRKDSASSSSVIQVNSNPITEESANNKPLESYLPAAESELQETSIVTSEVLAYENSLRLRQPNEVVQIEIFSFVRGLRMKQQQPSSGEEVSPNNKGNGEDILEIEKEEFFAYLLSKVWQNNEVMSYDINQLRAILSTASHSDTSDVPTSSSTVVTSCPQKRQFSVFFTAFFNEKIRASQQALLDSEKNMADRVLMKNKLKREIEITSETFLSLMRIIYVLLDVAHVDEDIACLLPLLDCVSNIYKLVLRPDDNENVQRQQQRIYIKEGIVGRAIFKYTLAWKKYFSQLIETIEVEFAENIYQAASAAGGDTEEECKVDDLNESNFFIDKLLVAFTQAIELGLEPKALGDIIADTHLPFDVAKHLQEWVKRV